MKKAYLNFEAEFLPVRSYSAHAQDTPRTSIATYHL